MSEALLREEDEVRTELIHGKIVLMSPRPRVNHTRISGNIYAAFKAALTGKTCEAFTDGVDVYLDEKNHFVPDVMIVRNPSQVKRDHVEGAPTLVVEVLSPSTQVRDRSVKMRAYAAAGVQEYWIVDPEAKRVEVYRQQSGQMELHRVYTRFTPEQRAEEQEVAEDFRLSEEDMEQNITVDLCGGFQVPLAEIFERVS